MIQEALELARIAHRGQLYGEMPYTTHLCAVVQNLRRFELATPRREAVALLHDSLEDCSEALIPSLREMTHELHPSLLRTVEALTTRGGSRRERSQRLALQFEDLREEDLTCFQDSFVVKLADRLSNVESSRDLNPQLFSMYRKDQGSFELLCELGEGAFPDIEERFRVRAMASCLHQMFR